MKTQKTIIITFLFLNSLSSLAQFDIINQKESYKKLKVREIKVFFHDSTLVEYDELLKVDTNGRIIYHELLADTIDSINSVELWNYKKDILTSYLNIGVWNVKTNKIDTTLTEYFFDLQNNLIRSQTTKTYDKDTLYTFYESNNGKILSSKLYNKNQEWWFVVDSIEYYPNGQPKLKTRISYDNKLIEFKQEQYYDTTGTIQLEIFYSPDYNCYKIKKTKTYLYNNDKLSSIKEVNLGDGYFSKRHWHTETIFEYYPNGLLKKQTRLWDGEILNYDTYEYK